MKEKHETYQQAKYRVNDANSKMRVIHYAKGFRIRNYIKALASHIKADLDRSLIGGIK